MANQVLQSTNFTINFDPALLPKSPLRAAALFRVVESEFTALTEWFGITSGFGPGNRTIINFVGSLSSGGANNFGYRSDGTTTMNLISRETDPSDTNAASIVQMSFVAEFVEILMGYRNTQGPETWNAGYSHGEGLSLMCAQKRFRAGYKAAYGTWVNPWMQLPDRGAASHDWITNPKKTDSDSESYGCSLLFLFYLETQLGHSMQDIIQKAGNTLELTYQNLTGLSGGINALRNLIDPIFPVGNTPLLLNDDPFPLARLNSRSIDIDAETAAYGSPYIVRSGAADVSPGPVCPKKHYHFDILSTPQQLTCSATAKGFGQPVYTWRINGVDVAGSGSVSPTVTVTLDEPGQSPPVITKTIPVTIQCAIITTPFTSTLVLGFNSVVEHIDLVIEAFAHEKFGSTDVTSDIDWITVHNEKVVWDADYNSDREKCTRHWRDLVSRYVRADPFFSILHTLPDPPEEYARVFRQLSHLSVAIDRFNERSPEQARQMERGIEQSLGINLSLLRDIGRLGRVGRPLSDDSAPLHATEYAEMS